MTPDSAEAVGTRCGQELTPTRPSRAVRVKGRGGNRLARPQATIIAAQHPAQQALPRNMTGWETPAGDAARPLPAQDAAHEAATRHASSSERVSVVPPGPRRGAKRRLRTDRLTPVQHGKGAAAPMMRNVVSPARASMTAHLVPTTGEVRPSEPLSNQHDRSEMRKPTEQEIEAAKTPRGGWTKETLAAWGVSWPPPRGWKQRLVSGGDE